VGRCCSRPRQTVRLMPESFRWLSPLDGNDLVFIARASPTRVFSSGIVYRLPAAVVLHIGPAGCCCHDCPTMNLRCSAGDGLAPPHLTPFPCRKKRCCMPIRTIARRILRWSKSRGRPGFPRSCAGARYDVTLVAAITGTHVDRDFRQRNERTFLPPLMRRRPRQIVCWCETCRGRGFSLQPREFCSDWS